MYSFARGYLIHLAPLSRSTRHTGSGPEKYGRSLLLFTLPILLTIAHVRILQTLVSTLSFLSKQSGPIKKISQSYHQNFGGSDHSSQLYMNLYQTHRGARSNAFSHRFKTT